MKTHTKWLTTSTAFLLTTGCMEDTSPTEFDKDSKTTRKQKIVINDFDAEHPGHHWSRGHESYQAYIQSSNPSDPSAQLALQESTLNYRLMMITESSPAVIVNPRLMEECTGVSPDGGLSLSSTLTSPSRITTAHHGVVADDDQLFDLRFNASNVNNDEDAGLWYDSTATGSKENPLLSHRLFSLGLDQFALNKGPYPGSYREGARLELRRWHDWIVDREGSPSLSQLHIIESSPNFFVGKDVEFLKPRDPHQLMVADGLNDWDDKAKLEYLPSGIFSIYGPGPFFNVALRNGYAGDEDICPMENTYRMFLGQHLNYDENSASDKLSFVTSGYTDENNEISCINDTRCIALGVQGNFDYEGCIKTTMDVWVGSSGGGVYDNRCRVDGGSEGYDVLEKYKNHYVYKGLAHGTQAAIESPTPTKWSEVLQHDMAEEAQTTFSNDVNISTVLGFLETAWSQRDRDFSTAKNPFNPKPDQPASDGCPGVEDNGVCYLNLSESESTDGGFPATGVSPPTIQDTGTGSGGSSSANESSQANYQNELASLEGNYGAILCDSYGVGSGAVQVYNEDNNTSEWRSGISMMQGILGSAKSSTERPPMDRVDALAAVCTPWSSAAWTTNWNWVSLNFNTISNIYPGAPKWLEGVAAIEYRTRIRLSEALGLLHEVRHIVEDNFFQIRPPSMKNCPPNYYLGGIKYTISSEELSVAKVVGITGLICKAHKPRFDAIEAENKDIEPITNYPLKETNGHKGYKVDVQIDDGSGGLTNLTVPYSLDQTIGNPESDIAVAPAAKEVSTECKFNRVATGIILGRDSNFDINHISLLCARAPEGGL